MRDFEGDGRSPVVDIFGIERGAVMREATFEALGADSLDLLELAMVAEDTFGIADIPDEDWQKWTTFGEFVDYVKATVEAQ